MILDIQSKKCYIYDYLHDDQPELNKNMTYKNTTKKRIDAKFIISSYGSIDKDQVAYHIMFKPSEKIYFNDNDDMFYYEQNYRKRYDMTYPVGLMIDIPDEKGVYVKWLICDYEESNQFTKYVVLPCDYKFQWISVENGKTIKRQMWGCTRAMNSYTAGTWIDRYINSLDDVNKVLLPLNNITESIWYTREDNENQRVIVSAKMKNPLTWKITKVENTKPIGIIKLTLDQDSFDPHRDYIEKDENGNIIGMWANYYDSNVEPIEPPEKPDSHEPIVICNITTSTYYIKDGGSYKTLVAKYYDENGNDISDNYSSMPHTWSYSIDSEDMAQYVTELTQENGNIIKIKFKTDDKQYLGKLLTINCSSQSIIGEAQLEITI